MEIFEIRYFNAVAECESIHSASLKLNVSSSALSKAISRLEEELGADLFSREGRNIRLTPKGIIFQKRAIEMLNLEKSIKASLNESHVEIDLRISGPDIYLSHFGVDLISDTKRSFPKISFQMQNMSEVDALKSVLNGESDICITSQNKAEGLVYEPLAQVKFATFAGHKHVLANSKRKIHIQDLLEYDFLLPLEETLGVTNHTTADGWRDDKFPRKLRYKNIDLKSIENLVVRGHALAYMPEYFGDSIQAVKLNIDGCPYKCEQKIYLAMSESTRKWLSKK